MELTLENKAKFFAQYWGIETTGSDFYGEIMPDTWINFPKEIHNQFLILKPLSSIIDEDSLKVREIMHWPNKGIKSVSQTIVLLNINMFPMILTDYLRSKGYALPWNVLSVEDMVTAGWIKLKED